MTVLYPEAAAQARAELMAQGSRLGLEIHRATGSRKPSLSRGFQAEPGPHITNTDVYNYSESCNFLSLQLENLLHYSGQYSWCIRLTSAFICTSAIPHEMTQFIRIQLMSQGFK